MHAFDRQTDGQTDRCRQQDSAYMFRSRTVKTVLCMYTKLLVLIWSISVPLYALLAVFMDVSRGTQAGLNCLYVSHMQIVCEHW